MSFHLLTTLTDMCDVEKIKREKVVNLFNISTSKTDHDGEGTVARTMFIYQNTVYLTSCTLMLEIHFLLIFLIPYVDIYH